MKISKTSAVLFGILGLTAGTAGAIAFQTQAAGVSAAATTPAGFKHGTPPAAAGNVTAINGSTITVMDKRTGTTYTVDTSGATIQKFTLPASGTTPTTKPTPTTITISGITAGDNVTVQGTVSGHTITATKIMDGTMMGRGGFGGHGLGGSRGQVGTVSAINGNTITLTGKNGTTYTINAGSAAVKKVSDSNFANANIAVGDTLQVNGSTSGTTITATNIVDGVIGFGKGSQPSTTTSPPGN
jgi:hypothetical protein